jgi:GxxExxY protein
MRKMTEDLLYKELSKDIIGAAMEVLNELRPGLDAKLYENALVIELERRGHKVSPQSSFQVHYKGRFIGRLVPDLIIDDLVIVDAKVVTAFNETHMAQMVGYLAKTGLKLALLINFKHAKLLWKRIVREHE